MESKEIISNEQIENNLASTGFYGTCIDEGRLVLTELITKVGAGYYVSHTENNFLMSFKLTKKDRTPNKRGRRFICAMLHSCSNRKSEVYFLIERFRK